MATATVMAVADGDDGSRRCARCDEALVPAARDRGTGPFRLLRSRHCNLGNAPLTAFAGNRLGQPGLDDTAPLLTITAATAPAATASTTPAARTLTILVAALATLDHLGFVARSFRSLCDLAMRRITMCRMLVMAHAHRLAVARVA